MSIPAIPVPPAAPVAAPPSRAQAAWRGSVAALLILLGIGSQVAGAGFPANAPVEMFMNFGITVVAVVAGVVLVVLAVLAATRPSVILSRGRVSPLAVFAVVFVGVALLVWLLSVPFQLATGLPLRYMELSAPVFFTGLLWSVGTVFGAIAVRHPARASTAFGIAAVAVGLALVSANVWAAAMYSAGLTD